MQVKLAQHVYSNLFGTFLCNTSQERVQAEIGERTYSVWSLLRLNRHRYTNYLYSHTHQVILLAFLVYMYTRERIVDAWNN